MPPVGIGAHLKELSKKVGAPHEGHARGMGKVLSHMGRLLLSLKDNSIPQISSLVVLGWGPNKGLPDEGIAEFWPNYPSLTKSEKLNMIRREYTRIKLFGDRWNKVLLDLGIEAVS